MNAKVDLSSLNRDSTNGMETTICIRHYEKPADWDWVLLRYPLDIHDTTESEIVHHFDGPAKGFWQRALDWTREYLTAHLEDGFCA